MEYILKEQVAVFVLFMYSFSLRVAFVFERLFSCVDCFTQLFVVC